MFTVQWAPSKLQVNPFPLTDECGCRPITWHHVAICTDLLVTYENISLMGSRHRDQLLSPSTSLMQQDRPVYLLSLLLEWFFHVFPVQLEASTPVLLTLSLLSLAFIWFSEFLILKNEIYLDLKECFHDIGCFTLYHCWIWIAISCPLL